MPISSYLYQLIQGDTVEAVGSKLMPIIDKLIIVRAVENTVYLGHCNMPGTEKVPPTPKELKFSVEHGAIRYADEVTFGGGSMIVNPFGEVLVSAKKFEDDFIVAEVDLNEVCLSRRRFPQLLHRGRWPEVFGDLPKRFSEKLFPGEY